MKEIPLTQGEVAIVDDDDYEWLNKYNWFSKPTKNSPLCYAIRNVWEVI